MSRPTIRAAAAAWATPLLVEGAALVRNIVLARLLGPDEAGKLMLLALTLRLMEMVSDLSAERLIAQADDGGSLRLQRALQALGVARGLLLSLLLLALALPLARLAGGDLAPLAIAGLALSPALRGFVHLDHRRRERVFDYRATLLMEAGAAIAMLAVAPVAAVAFGDHRALVPVVAVQAAALLILSHLVARRRWRCAAGPGDVARAFRFGAPLLLNGVLLFLVVQGDRLVIAAHYDWAGIAMFAVAAQVAILPALVAGRAAAMLLLPGFRRARAAGTLGAELGNALFAWSAVAAAFLVGFGFLAPFAIGLLYGAAFAPGPALAFALGAAAAIRIARTPLSQAAIAIGRTGMPSRANLWRAVTLGVAALAAAAGAPMAAVALAGAVGEACAALAAAHMTARALRAEARAVPSGRFAAARSAVSSIPAGAAP